MGWIKKAVLGGHGELFMECEAVILYNSNE